MSSNIKIQRICQYCGKEFTARTTVTRYCGEKCNSRAYKATLRAAKVQSSNTETQRIKNQPIEELNAREFLTVTQVSKLLGCSRQNVYNLINTGKLKATNILLKKTLVRRSDIDKLFLPRTERVPEPKKQALTLMNDKFNFDISQCYNLDEIKNKYGISESELQQLISQNGIPKIKLGWYSYLPKTAIDNLFN